MLQYLYQKHFNYKSTLMASLLMCAKKKNALRIIEWKENISQARVGLPSPIFPDINNMSYSFDSDINIDKFQNIRYIPSKSWK